MLCMIFTDALQVSYRSSAGVLPILCRCLTDALQVMLSLTHQGISSVIKTTIVVCFLILHA